MAPVPAYSVEVRGDGQVLFDGKSNVLILGHHHASLSKQGVDNLVAAFRRADYFSLKDKYTDRHHRQPYLQDIHRV